MSFDVGDALTGVVSTDGSAFVLIDEAAPLGEGGLTAGLKAD